MRPFQANIFILKIFIIIRILNLLSSANVTLTKSFMFLHEKGKNQNFPEEKPKQLQFRKPRN